MSRKRVRTEDSKIDTANGKSSSFLSSTASEPTIFNIKPTNDFVKVVSDFLYEYVDIEHVEIEAKLGVLVDRNTKERIKLPVACETIIDRKEAGWMNMNFESNMTLEQHRRFNNLLNERVTQTNAPNYPGVRVSYQHTRETDRFYNVNGTKIRVTTDQKTGDVLDGRIVEKKRIADLNIYSPNTLLDYRITVNVEKPNERPSSLPTFERNKDRMSYTHEIFKFDLTQVKVPQANGVGTEITHELEVEFIDPTILLHEKEKIKRKEANMFIDIVEKFIDNIRTLANVPSQM